MWYVEAYRKDGSQILGNLDGQTAYRGKDYFRTDHYKFIRDGCRNKRFARVHHFQVIHNGKCKKIITNPHYDDTK